MCFTAALSAKAESLNPIKGIKIPAVVVLPDYLGVSQILPHRMQNARIPFYLFSRQ